MSSLIIVKKKIPLPRETLRLGVLYLLEHLVVLEVPINKVYTVTQTELRIKYLYGLSLQIRFAIETNMDTYMHIQKFTIVQTQFRLSLQEGQVHPLQEDQEDQIGPGIPCHPVDL